MLHYRNFTSIGGRIFSLLSHHQLDLKLRNMYWIIGRKSQLSLANKLLVYKAILKPIWTYGIQLWGTASNSNIDILERFQSKALRIITDAPWYVPNAVIKHDLQVASVRQELRTFSVTHHARLEGHPSDLATSCFNNHLTITDSSGTTPPT